MARRNRKLMTMDQKRNRRSRWIRFSVVMPLRIILLTSLGVGIGVTGYFIARFLKTSPALTVRTIEVRGSEKTLVKEILRVGGLTEGMNIFEVDMPRVEQKIRELSWIKSVRVSRVVPDRILVEIEEQYPVATIVLGGIYLVNPEGEVFKRVQSGEIVDLPVITGITRSDFREDPKRAHKDVLNALELLAQLESVACLHQKKVAEIHFDELMGFTVVLDPGAMSIRLGKKGFLVQWPALCELFAELEQRNLQAHRIFLDHPQREGWATVQLDSKTFGLDRTVNK